MGRFQPQTWEEICTTMKHKADSGKLKSNNSCSPYAPVKATTIHGKELQWPHQHQEWMAYSHQALKTFELVLHDKITPRWEYVRYRDETNFKAGTYSAYIPIWLILVNMLPDDKTKQLAYRLVFHGASVFDNQADISIRNSLPYRDKYQLCTKKTLNTLNFNIFNKLHPDDRHGNTFKLGGTKYSIYSYYPVEVVKDKNKKA